jgi:hypothetical protein
VRFWRQIWEGLWLIVVVILLLPGLLIVGTLSVVVEGGQVGWFQGKRLVRWALEERP